MFLSWSCAACLRPWRRLWVSLFARQGQPAAWGQRPASGWVNWLSLALCWRRALPSESRPVFNIPAGPTFPSATDLPWRRHVPDTWLDFRGLGGPGLDFSLRTLAWPHNELLYLLWHSLVPTSIVLEAAHRRVTYLDLCSRQNVLQLALLIEHIVL